MLPKIYINLDLILKSKGCFYSFVKNEDNYIVLEDLKFKICSLSQNEFELFLESVFDWVMTEEGDVELLGPFHILDKGEFVENIKSSVSSSVTN